MQFEILTLLSQLRMFIIRKIKGVISKYCTIQLLMYVLLLIISCMRMDNQGENLYLKLGFLSHEEYVGTLFPA